MSKPNAGRQHTYTSLDDWLNKPIEITKSSKELKSCPGCGRVLVIAYFQTKSGRTYPRCKACRRTKSNAEYRGKRSLHLGRKSIKSELLKQFGNKCERCGYDEFESSLEFHHLNRNTKDSTISRLVGAYATAPSDDKWERLVAECSKCTVLCSNCHQALHAQDW